MGFKFGVIPWYVRVCRESVRLCGVVRAMCVPQSTYLLLMVASVILTKYVYEASVYLRMKKKDTLILMPLSMEAGVTGQSFLIVQEPVVVAYNTEKGTAAVQGKTASSH